MRASALRVMNCAGRVVCKGGIRDLYPDTRHCYGLKLPHARSKIARRRSEESRKIGVRTLDNPIFVRIRTAAGTVAYTPVAVERSKWSNVVDKATRIQAHRAPLTGFKPARAAFLVAARPNRIPPTLNLVAISLTTLRLDTPHGAGAEPEGCDKVL